MLMALGEPLPKQILGHPWLLFGEDKMSKSKGNVIYADEMVEEFGADAVRYYLLSEMPFAMDGSITYESFISRYNTDLANTLGNLVNRSIAMADKYFGGSLHRPAAAEGVDNDLIACAKQTYERYESLMDDYRNADAAAAVMELARRCNKYIDETAPWVLAKSEDSRERLNAVLYNLIECIRVLAVMLKPMIPATVDKMAVQLAMSEDAFTPESVKSGFGLFDELTVGTAGPLFERIDAEKVLAELTAKAEAAKKAAEAEAAKAAEAEKKSENVVTAAEIAIDDFAKVELRTAKVVACEPVKRAKKLLKLTLDDGSDTERTVASGIAQYYSPDELIGRTVIVVANLKPATLCGVESCGMILAADTSDGVKVIFVDGVEPGAKIR